MQPSNTDRTSWQPQRSSKPAIRTSVYLLALSALLLTSVADPFPSAITIGLAILLSLRFLLPRFGSGARGFGLVLLVLAQFPYEYISLSMPIKLVCIHSALILATYRCLVAWRGRTLVEITALSVFVILAMLSYAPLLGAIIITLAFMLVLSILFNAYLVRARGDTLDDIPLDRLPLNLVPEKFAKTVAVHAIVVVLFAFLTASRIPGIRYRLLASTGFQEDVVLGQASSIRVDQSIAFRVDFSGASSIPRSPYWRIQVADLYIKGRFFTSDVLRRDMRAVNATQPITVFDNAPAYDIPIMTFYAEPGLEKGLPLPPHARQLQVLSTAAISANQVTVEMQHLRNDALNIYRCFDAGFTGAIPDSLRPGHHYLYLAQDEASLSVLRPIAARCRRVTVPDTVEATIQYLEQNHAYGTGNLLVTGADPVSEWLKGTGPGHCEYFAASMTLLLRANNIPARLVGGFRGGVWNPHGGYLVVRNSEAHAWVEYFDKGGWTPADPTPGNRMFDGARAMLPNPSIPAYTGLPALIDGARMWWHRRSLSETSIDSRQAPGPQAVLRSLYHSVSQTIGNVADGVVTWTLDHRMLLFYADLPLVIIMLLLYAPLTKRLYPARYAQVQRGHAKTLMPRTAGLPMLRARLHHIMYGNPAEWRLPMFFWVRTLILLAQKKDAKIL